MKFGKLLCVFFVCLFSLLLFYTLVRPIFYRFDALTWPTRPLSLEEARNYYGILSAITTVLFGFLGLLLGFLYFIRRQRFDLANRKRDQLRKILDMVINKIDFIDSSCNKILNNCGSSVNDKKSIVADVSTSWNTFNSILENHAGFLQFQDLDVYEIAAAYSVVDIEILKQDTATLPKQKHAALVYDYNAKMRKARKILYSKYFDNIG